MSEESLSIEETSKLRHSLGLKPIPVPNAQSEPQPSNEESLSIDETNKLRASLGLKPIEIDTTAVTGQTTEDYQHGLLKKDKEEKIKRNLELAKSKALKRRKINVSRNLLDDEEETDSLNTDEWLSKIGKSKSTTASKAKRVPQSRVGDDFSLAGLKVNHNVEDINALGTDVVLTLKEQSIFEEDDELESEVLNKQNRLEKELAEKLRSNKYDKNGEERGLLDRYEEQLDQNNNNHFMLDGSVIKVETSKSFEDLVQEETGPKKRIQFNIDLDEGDVNEDLRESDYAKSKPIKMKKINKLKKKSQTRQKELEKDEDDDIVLRTIELKDEDSNFNDDEELQNVLNLKRLKTQKKRTYKKPEDLAKEIKEDQENDMDVDADFNDHVIIDENTEFLNQIKNEVEEEESTHIVPNLETPNLETPLLENDVVKPTVKDDVSDPKNEGFIDEEEEQDNGPDVDFASGIGSTLSFLKSKNIVKEKTPMELENERLINEIKKKTDLVKIRTQIEKRIHEESILNDSDFKKLTKKEKEEILSKELDHIKDVLATDDDVQDKLQDYKPEINLKYIDDYGREMNQKEAYKHLSHKFHGKAPNKSKIEKTLKKIEDERKNQYKESIL